MENDRMMEALFAANALQGLATSMDSRRPAEMAAAAYAIADAMMAETRKRDEIRDKLRPRDQWARPA